MSPFALAGQPRSAGTAHYYCDHIRARVFGSVFYARRFSGRLLLRGVVFQYDVAPCPSF